MTEDTLLRIREAIKSSVSVPVVSHVPWSPVTR